MSASGTIKLNMGPVKNLITILKEVRECLVEGADEWWTMDVYIPVYYEFVGDWEPNLELRQYEFREKFAAIIRNCWAPSFSFYGDEIEYWFLQNTVQCYLDFWVLDMERTSFDIVFGKGWSEAYLKKRKQAVSVIEVYPGKQTNVHTVGNRMRIGEILDPIVKPVDDTDTNPESQIDAAHEMGHLLGYDHPMCTGGEPKCYGYAGSWQNSDIMGRGMNAASKQQQLYTAILKQFNGNYDWRLWEDLTVSASLINIRRRGLFNYPNSSGRLPGPIGKEPSQFA